MEWFIALNLASLVISRFIDCWLSIALGSQG